MTIKLSRFKLQLGNKNIGKVLRPILVQTGANRKFFFNCGKKCTFLNCQSKIIFKLKKMCRIIDSGVILTSNSNSNISKIEINYFRLKLKWFTKLHFKNFNWIIIYDYQVGAPFNWQLGPTFCEIEGKIMLRVATFTRGRYVINSWGVMASLATTTPAPRYFKCKKSSH